MLLGLISDTHGLLRPEVFSAFAGVERILHAGDVGDPDILIELEALAPVTAVLGNTDRGAIRDRLPEVAEVEIEGLKMVVLHGHQYGTPRPRQLAADRADASLILFGHTHQPAIERVGETVVVNPGSAGPARFSLPVTVALARVTRGRVEAEIVRLLGP